MRKLYQAKDGAIFESEQECIDHEISLEGKPKIVLDWLIENIKKDIDDRRREVDGHGEGDCERDSLELIKSLEALKKEPAIRELIENSEEVKSLIFNWKSNPSSLFAAKLILGLELDLDPQGIAALERAFNIFANAFFSTSIKQGLPCYPDIPEPWERASFADSVYYGLEASGATAYDRKELSALATECLTNRELCISCRHWEPGLDDPESSLWPTRGSCKRYPHVNGVFPETLALDSCGEWSRR